MKAQVEMLQLRSVDGSLFRPTNVGGEERLGSIVIGALILLLGLTYRTLKAVPLVLGGLYLLYRGLSGHCAVYEILRMNTADYGAEKRGPQPPPPSVADSDEVVESSWESFPTSDPPAWTMGTQES